MGNRNLTESRKKFWGGFLGEHAFFDGAITANKSAADLLALLVAGAGGGIASFTQRNVVANSTAYNPGDVVALGDGRIVMINTACVSSSAGFISAANYVLWVPQHVIYAQSYGLLVDGNPASAGVNYTALQAAVNAANPTNANAVGGIVVLPRGQFYTNATIDLPNGVCIQGNNTFGTYWSLATDSNCTMIKPHTSLFAGNANAFFWQLRDFTLDCRHSSQGSHAITDVSMTAGSTTITSTARPWLNSELVWGSGILPSTTIVPGSQAGTGPYTATLSAPAAQTLSPATVFAGLTVPIYGIHCQTNPLNSFQSGDFAFDPSGTLFNIHVRNARDSSFANFGRSANKYIACKSSACLGISFIGSFDTRYDCCESDVSGWHGWDLRGSSQILTGCKSYNSGQNITTAGAAFNTAHGFKLSGFVYFGEISIAGCDAQQNTGDGFNLTSVFAASIAGCTVAYVGFGSGATTASGFTLDGCTDCVISAAVNGIVGTHALNLIGGSDKNSINLGFTGSIGAVVGTPLTAASATLTNDITIRGLHINAPGLVSSASVATALPLSYSRVSATGGGFFTPGAQASAIAAVLNRAEFIPIQVPRTGMTITTLIMRVGTAVATAVFRMGIYTSDFTGNDVFNLLGELPSLVDASTTGVKTITFTTPLIIPANSVIWVCTVPQVALAATFAGTAGPLVASGSSLGATAGYSVVSGFTGALPATYNFGTAAAPTGLSSAIQVTAVLIG